MFIEYFKLGWEHIMSWTAVDHLLFVMALVATFFLKDWRMVMILITAFTIGHSLSLALSTLKIIRFPSRWIEFLIPLTICVTALANAFKAKSVSKQQLRFSYVVALFFGVIHGMGFANGLMSLLGQHESLLLPLLGFNLGLEAGQIAVVVAFLLLSAFCFSVIKIKQREWVLFISGGAFFSAVVMLYNRWPF